PGWIPLWGNWVSSKGWVREGRPALYDPSTSTFHLLDFVDDPCTYCPGPEPLALVESSTDLAKPGPRVPVAADLDGDGLDGLVFFDLRTETFTYRDLTPSLRGERLWPFAIPPGGAQAAPHTVDRPDRPGLEVDALAVYSPRSGRYEVLTGGAGVRQLGAGVSSLPTVRHLGHPSSGAVTFEVYDASMHGLRPAGSLHTILDDCIPSGTQLLQFPSDPDPPPGPVITQGCGGQGSLE
ncbi:MAG: hypothetical protein AAFX50_26275, partial [Acidobacteriota bacterium]